MKKYDIFGLTNLIEKGLARKLEIVEEAVLKLGSEFEPLTIVESFVFLANTKNSQLYRVSYEINEGDVRFSNPTQFELDYDQSRFEDETKSIIGNIVEALDRDDETDVEYYRAKWVGSQRKRKMLESKLDLNVGTKSKYIVQTKKIVESAVNSVRGARSVLSKTKNNTNFQKLISEGSVVIETGRPINFTETAPESRRQLVLSKIVEARNAARSLLDSPVFSQYVTDLYKSKEKEIAVEFISENYQELFTLSLAEQTELFYAICESKLSIKPNLRRIVESLVEITTYTAANAALTEEINKLHTIIGSGGKDFHKRMNLIEDEVNTFSYTNNDISVLTQVLSDIIQQPNEFMAPEFITEAKRLLRKLNVMVESNNIDDAQVAVIVNFISQFYPQTIKNLGESEGSDAYQEYFKGMLKKWGVESPADLKDDKKKEFFDAVDKGWKSEDSKEDDSKGKTKGKGKTTYADGQPDVDSETGFPTGSLDIIISDKGKTDDQDEDDLDGDVDSEEEEEEEGESEKKKVAESWESDLVDGDAAAEEEKETPMRAIATHALVKMTTGPRQYDRTFARTVSNAIARNNARLLAKTVEAQLIDMDSEYVDPTGLANARVTDIIAILIEFNLVDLLRQLKLLRTTIETEVGITREYLFKTQMLNANNIRFNRWGATKTLKQMADAKGINLRTLEEE